MYLVYSNKTGKLIDRVISVDQLNQYNPDDVTIHIIHL